MSDTPKPIEQLDLEDIMPVGTTSTVMNDPVYGPIVSGHDIVLPELDLAALDADIAADEKYGNSSVRAGAEGLARGATMGLSDVLGKAIGADEGLRERKKRNPVSAGVGEIAGTVAGLVSGTGPVAATARAGQAIERVTAKALQETLKGTGRGKIAASIAKSLAPVALSGAAEGAAFNAAHLTSEAALGNADLTAENIMGSVGTGALLGGVLNTSIGAASSLVPALKKGGQYVAEKSKRLANDIADPTEVVKEFSGFTPTDVVKIERRNPEFFKELPEFYRERVKLERWDSADDVAKKVVALKADAGRRIDAVTKQLDEFTKTVNPELLPTRATQFDELLNVVKKHEDELRLSPEVTKGELRVINDFKSDIIKRGLKDEPVTFGELNDLRKLYDKKAKFNGLGSPADNFRSSLAAEMRATLRKQTDKLATMAGELNIGQNAKTLAADLKQANKDFNISATVEPKILVRAEKGGQPISHQRVMESLFLSGFGGPVGMVAAAAREFSKSDLRKRMVILSDMKKMSDAMTDKVGNSVSNFLTKAKRTAQPVSFKTLANSMFSRDYEAKENPKTRQQAFKNISKNIIAYKTDPEKLINRLAVSTAVVSQAAPQIAQELHNSAVRAVNFLSEKLPKNNSDASNFASKREFQPSSLDLAKFERYLQVVESPASVLDDLEHGSLTREHVEALSVVYPQLYQQIRVSAMSGITANPDALPYSKRIQIGILLDIPADESLVPENVLALQETFGNQQPALQEPSASSGGAVNPTQTGLAKIDKSDRMKTGLESTLTRKS